MYQSRLVTAAVMERDHGLSRISLYRMAKGGLIPCYKVGPKRRGVRFVAVEVLAALKSDGEDGGKASI
jgi:hypothetical protein